MASRCLVVFSHMVIWALCDGCVKLLLHSSVGVLFGSGGKGCINWQWLCIKQKQTLGILSRWVGQDGYQNGTDILWHFAFGIWRIFGA